MNENLESIFSKAANSNLTATALEFIPRSVVHVESQPGPSNSRHAGKFCDTMKKAKMNRNYFRVVFSIFFFQTRFRMT